MSANFDNLLIIGALNVKTSMMPSITPWTVHFSHRTIYRKTIHLLILSPLSMFNKTLDPKSVFHFIKNIFGRLSTVHSFFLIQCLSSKKPLETACQAWQKPSFFPCLLLTFDGWNGFWSVVYPSFSQQGVCRWQKELLLCKQGVTISKIMNASFIVRSLEILLSWNPINPTIHLRCLVIQSWGAAKDGSSVKFSNWGVYWLPLGKWCFACQNEKNQEFLAIQNLQSLVRISYW